MAESKSRIALCIPTKDRFDCIKELLLDFPRINNICCMDVYIYDSSVGDEVEKYIADYDKKYNIYYRRIKQYQDTDGNAYKGTDQAALKLYDIYFEFAGNEKYDYVWVSGDSIRFTDNILTQISDVENDYDLITIVTDKLNEVVYKKRQNVIWNNAGQYIKYNTGVNTLFGSVLVNTKSLACLKDNEVSFWYKDTKYLSFAYIRLYAEVAIKSTEFKGISIFDEYGIKRSKYKIGIGWQNNFFEVFYECFIDVVNSLPVDEDCKKYIIEYYYRNNTIYNEKVLEYMRLRNDLNKEVLEKWKEYIEYAVPYKIVKQIVDTPVENIIAKQEKIKEEFVNFIGSHNKVYIYGAGCFGIKYQVIAQQYGTKIEGFIVSHKDNNPDYIHGYKVYEYEDIKNDLSGAGIVLGLNENNAIQVKSTIQEQVKANDIYENYNYHLWMY